MKCEHRIIDSVESKINVKIFSFKLKCRNLFSTFIKVEIFPVNRQIYEINLNSSYTCKTNKNKLFSKVFRSLDFS